MRFDDDGHLIVLAALFTGSQWQAHLHRVLRSGGASLLQVLPFTTAAIDIDEQTGTAYLVRNPGANLYRLDPPYTSPPSLLQAYSASAYGLAFVPSSGAGQLLIPTTWPSFLVWDFGTSTLSQLTSSLPLFAPLMYLQHHARSQRVWGVKSENGPDSIYWCAPTLQSVSVGQVTSLGLLGSVTAMTMNGIPPGSLYVAPMNVPPQTGFLFEAGVWGRPGDLGLLVMTQPFLHVLAVGLCDAAGVLAVKFPVPAGAVQPGSPGQLQLQGVTVDLQTFQPTFSAPKAWPRN